MGVVLQFPESAGSERPSNSAIVSAIIKELVEGTLNKLSAAVIALETYQAIIGGTISTLPKGEKRDEFERQRMEIQLQISIVRRLLTAF